MRFPKNIATHPTVIQFYEWLYYYDPFIRKYDYGLTGKIIRVRSFNSYQTSNGHILSPIWDWQRIKIFFFIRPYMAIVKPPIKEEPKWEPPIHPTFTWNKRPGTMADDINY